MVTKCSILAYTIHSTPTWCTCVPVQEKRYRKIPQRSMQHKLACNPRKSLTNHPAAHIFAELLYTLGGAMRIFLGACFWSRGTFLVLVCLPGLLSFFLDLQGNKNFQGQ